MNLIPMRNEIYRKLFHISLLVIPAFYYFYGKSITVSILVIACLIVVLVDKYRHRNIKLNQIFIKVFKPILRDHEIMQEKLTGASFVVISALITFLVFKPAIAFCAFCILAISDSSAAIIGRSIKSEPFFEKSSAGSLAFVISGLLTLLVSGYIYNVNLSFYLFGILGVLTATIIEARPSLFEYDDNFTIPISFALAMTVFDIIWNFRF